MIQWLQKNNKSLTVFLVIAAVVLSMSFFGVDIGSGRSQSSAIKINDDNFTFQDFQKERRNKQQVMAEQYRKIFGDKFNQYADQLLNIKDQQVVDDLIAQSLIKQEANRLNLYVGVDELKNVIRTEVFSGDFDPNIYAAYLTRSGLTSRAFEEKIRQNELLQNYRSILSDIAKPSDREVKNALRIEGRKYDLKYIEVEPAQLLDKEKEPSEETLKNYFEERQTDYEVPAQISYEYAVLNPAKYKSTVPVADEDIEMYFSENESAYKTPEEAKLKHIQITFPPGANDETKAKLRVKAEEAHSKAQAGDNFDLLVAQYSDDLTTTGKNGELGWVKPGIKDKRFDDAVFKLKTVGVPDLIETDYGFHIVKIEEYVNAGTKKLADVKDAIIEEIRSKEAPAFTSAKANEIYENWTKNKLSFADLAKQNDLSIEKPNIALSEKVDPSPEFEGLSKKVLETPDLKEQLIEFGDKSILVNVISYSEAKIPALKDIKDKVALDYRRAQAMKNAENTANLIMENKDHETIESLAKKYSLKVLEEKGFSKTSEKKGILMEANLDDELTAITTPNTEIKKVYKIGGKFHVFFVAGITNPSEQDIEKNITARSQTLAEEGASSLLNSNVYRLKAKADIYVEPSLFTGS